jgi:hypothetical protein
MDEFDALLKRSFAEAHEPADDGFSVAITSAVAKRERFAQARSVAQAAGLAIAGAATAYGAYAVLQSFAPEILASVGLGLARAHAAFGAPVTNTLQGLSASMTQILLIVGAGAGGLVAYRTVRE